MKNTANYTKKYSSIILFVLAILSMKISLESCTPECYESHEPEVYLTIKNNCNYKQISAKGIIAPINIDNNCADNEGTATITLPLLDTVKTFYLTDGVNIIDSFIFNYNLYDFYQGRQCGYVVMLHNFMIDSTNSTLPFYHLHYNNVNDTLHPYIYYATFADYMLNYW